MTVRSSCCTCDSATPAMFIANSISRLPNIRPSWEPNRRAGFSALKSVITSVTNAWPNSTPPDFVTTVCSRPPHLCGEDLLDPSADSERLVRCEPPELWSRGVARWFRWSLSVSDPFVCRCLTSPSCSVSTPRSSNRTGAFRASGSRRKAHEVAHGKLRVRPVRRAKPKKIGRAHV